MNTIWYSIFNKLYIYWNSFAKHTKTWLYELKVNLLLHVAYPIQLNSRTVIRASFTQNILLLTVVGSIPPQEVRILSYEEAYIWSIHLNKPYNLYSDCATSSEGQIKNTITKRLKRGKGFGYYNERKKEVAKQTRSYFRLALHSRYESQRFSLTQLGNNSIICNMSFSLSLATASTWSNIQINDVITWLSFCLHCYF